MAKSKAQTLNNVIYGAVAITEYSLTNVSSNPEIGLNAKNIKVNYSSEFLLSEKGSLIRVTATLELNMMLPIEFKNQPVAFKLKTEHVFDYSQSKYLVSKKKGESPVVNAQLENQIESTVLATVRGIALCKLSGTPFDGFVMPFAAF